MKNQSPKRAVEQGSVNVEPYVPPFIRRIMPKATEAEIQQAAENLRAYMKVLYEIFLEREAKGTLEK